MSDSSKARVTVDLSKFNNDWYRPGSGIKRLLWYLCSLLFIQTTLPIPSSIKRWWLCLFGARIGRGFVLKPSCQIKYPWLLTIGDNVWIGEAAWIDNLAQVTIGNNVCISQGAYLLTGNHDYKKESFDLMVQPITIEDGVWVGAKAVVCPGAVLKSHSIITVGSIIHKETAAYTIYGGNPAVPLRKREMAKPAANP